MVYRILLIYVYIYVVHLLVWIIKYVTLVDIIRLYEQGKNNLRTLLGVLDPEDGGGIVFQTSVFAIRCN